MHNNVLGEQVVEHSWSLQFQCSVELLRSARPVDIRESEIMLDCFKAQFNCRLSRAHSDRWIIAAEFAIEHSY